MVERAAEKLSVQFPLRETNIRVFILRLQVAEVGAHYRAGKAIVAVFQAWCVLMPRSSLELSPSVTVIMGSITQESKISCKW